MTRLLPCQQVLLVYLAALICACGTTSSTPEQNYDPKEVVLHLDYRSGGDAPLAFTLTILDDWRIRFLSPRGKEKWSKLDRAQQERVENLLRDSAFASALGLLSAEGGAFACCDFHELGVYIDADRPPIPVRFGEDPLPREIRDFLVFINALGRQHFGRSYSIPLPVDAARK